MTRKFTIVVTYTDQTGELKVKSFEDHSLRQVAEHMEKLGEIKLVALAGHTRF